MDGIIHGEHSSTIGHELSGEKVLASINPIRHNPAKLPGKAGAIQLIALLACMGLDFVGAWNIHIALHNTERLFFRVNNEQNVFW